LEEYDIYKIEPQRNETQNAFAQVGICVCPYMWDGASEDMRIHLFLPLRTQELVTFPYGHWTYMIAEYDMHKSENLESGKKCEAAAAAGVGKKPVYPPRRCVFFPM
jgi:hypothetical protein